MPTPTTTTAREVPRNSAAGRCRTLLLILALFSAPLSTVPAAAQHQADTNTHPDSSAQKPHIIIIYADDMGLGDVSHYAQHFGSANAVPTPHIDSIAHNGITFLNGHSANAVCTPSRYSLLTGRYNFRHLTGITNDYGRAANNARPAAGITLPIHIPRASDHTIAEYLHQQGYQTSAFGKWHLGGQWYSHDNQLIQAPFNDKHAIAWENPVVNHATDHGFEHFSGLATSINMQPYIYLQNNRHSLWVPEANNHQGAYLPILPDSPEHAQAHANQRAITRAQATDGNPQNGEISHISQQQLDGIDPDIAQSAARPGLGDHHYQTIQASPKITADFAHFLNQRRQNQETRPLFAYLSLYGPHLPWSALPQFRQGDSPEQYADSHIYGAYLRQIDAQVGDILDLLRQHNLLENSLLIFTADNGPEHRSIHNSLPHNHDPNGPLRGHKRGYWQGGTQVPFLLQWPGHAPANSSVQTPIWQGDILATLPAILHHSPQHPLAADGVNILPLIQAPEDDHPQRAVHTRPGFVISSRSGQLALITPDLYKYIPQTSPQQQLAPGHVGASWDSQNHVIPRAQVDAAIQTQAQLYHLATDPGETTNLLHNARTLAQVRQQLIHHTNRDLHQILQTIRHQDH